MVNNNLGGILLIGSSIFIPELGDQLDAVVRGNDLSNNAGTQGFGLRIFILRRDPGLPGDTQSSGHVRALVQGNRIFGNRVGLTLDAGFPPTEAPPASVIHACSPARSISSSRTTR